MVTYGNASGPVEPFSMSELTARGSLYINRPGINAYTATTEEPACRAHAVFSAIEHGHIRVSIERRYPMREAATAHHNLETRKTTGSVMLIS